MDKYMKLKDIPKGQRWSHFKEYYKFQTFMAVFFGILLITLVKDMFFSEKYDITITEATTTYYAEEIIDDLDKLFIEHTRDFDGNGKRSIAPYHIFLDTAASTGDVNMFMAAQTKLLGQFQDENNIIFLLNDEVCDYLLGDEGIDASFANIKEVVGGSAVSLLREGDEYRLYLKDLPAYQDSEYLRYISDDVFFVMRKAEHANPKGKEKLAKIYERNVQLMENLAAGAAEPEAAK